MINFLILFYFLASCAFGVGETPETAIDLTGDAEVEIERLLNNIPANFHELLWGETTNSNPQIDTELTEILFSMDDQTQEVPAINLFPNIQQYATFLENAQYMNSNYAQTLNHQFVQIIAQEYQQFLNMTSRNALTQVTFNYYNQLFNNYFNYQNNLQIQQVQLQQALVQKLASCKIPIPRQTQNNHKGGPGGKPGARISVFATQPTIQRSK